MRRAVPFGAGLFDDGGISGVRGCCNVVSRRRGDAATERKKDATRMSGFDRNIICHTVILEVIY